MPSNKQTSNEPLSWLLEPEDPDVRYLALRDLVQCSKNDPELRAARRRAHAEGRIAGILSKMQKPAYWIEPGPGYNPKYRSSVWALILLAQLGASVREDKRVEQACSYLLDHAFAEGGQFTGTGAPSGTADCLQGNLCWAMLELGCEDTRLQTAFDWMARSVTGEGIAPVQDRQAPVRYYAGKCGPLFACGSNNKLPCAWGAAKVMLAFGKWPSQQRTSAIEHAIQQGGEFLFSVDPAAATYPTGYASKPSGNWWKFGFPVFYVTDLLQIVEALVSLGYGHDPRLRHALAVICEKRDSNGRWALEYDYTGKTWGDFGEKKQPNKWVTLRALRVLKAVGAA